MLVEKSYRKIFGIEHARYAVFDRKLLAPTGAYMFTISLQIADGVVESAELAAKGEEETRAGFDNCTTKSSRVARLLLAEPDIINTMEGDERLAALIKSMCEHYSENVANA